MANLWITEATGLRTDPNSGSQIALLQEPGVATQKVAFTTATQSAAFNALTTIVRLAADADCNILFGVNPTADASAPKYFAGQEYFRLITAGQKLSVYDGTS